MAKDGPGKSPRPSPARPQPEARSPPALSSSDAVEDGAATKRRRHAPDPEILAKEEKARENFQEIFGQNLRAARLKSGLKQSDVAALTGLTQQYLSLIEAGQQNITLKTMILLAEVVDHNLLDMLKRAFDTPQKK